MTDWLYEISQLGMELSVENRQEAFDYIKGLIEKQNAHEASDAGESFDESDMGPDEAKTTAMACPHCGAASVRYGFKRGKQRYMCKSCRKTFVETTNTIRSNSHQSIGSWETVAMDTTGFVPLEKTAEKIGASVRTVHRMRHKILVGLRRQEEKSPTILGNTSEIDETYVLDSYKGKEIPEDFYRGPRKNGSKARAVK
jgi:transposase-like protein